MEQDLSIEPETDLLTEKAPSQHKDKSEKRRMLQCCVDLLKNWICLFTLEDPSLL